MSSRLPPQPWISTIDAHLRTGRAPTSPATSAPVPASNVTRSALWQVGGRRADLGAHRSPVSQKPAVDDAPAKAATTPSTVKQQQENAQQTAEPLQPTRLNQVASTDAPFSLPRSTHSSSNRIDAPLNAVRPPTSNGRRHLDQVGAHEVESRSGRARCASPRSLLIPPASGVPVPGREHRVEAVDVEAEIGGAGVRRRDAPPPLPSASRGRAARPSASRACRFATLKPHRPPGTLAWPRMPIWMTRLGVEQALLHRAAERRAVVIPAAEVIVAGIAMRVDVHHADRSRFAATARRIGSVIAWSPPTLTGTTPAATTVR